MQEMNLLPEEYLHEKIEKQRKRKILLLIGTSVFLLMVIYSILFSINSRLEKRIVSIDIDIASYQSIEENQMIISSYEDTIETRKELLNKLDKISVNQVVFLDALEKSLPVEMSLNTLSYLEENIFQIEGNTVRPETISEFMVNLAKIERVNDVMLHNVNYTIGGDNTSRFSIGFIYLLEGKEDDIN